MQKPIEGALGYVKKNGKLKLLLTVVIIGTVLLMLGSVILPLKKGNDLSASDEENKTERYVARLEDNISKLCSRVKGAGEVTVAVTVFGGFEYVYASDSKTSEDSDSTEYIKIGSGSSQQALYLTEKVPKISGVGIVCTGGGDERVRNELVLLISATYGISTNKIYVTEAFK